MRQITVYTKNRISCSPTCGYLEITWIHTETASETYRLYEKWEKYLELPPNLKPNIIGTLVGYKIVDHSPIGAAPNASSFSTYHLASVDWAKTTTRRDEKHLSFVIWCDLY